MPFIETLCLDTSHGDAGIPSEAFLLPMQLAVLNTDILMIVADIRSNRWVAGTLSIPVNHPALQKALGLASLS